MEMLTLLLSGMLHVYMPWCELVIADDETRRTSPGRLYGLIIVQKLRELSLDVVILPTPDWLELETQSNLNMSEALTISPLLAIKPGDTALIAYIPAPVASL